MAPATAHRARIAVVDDDSHVRDAVCALMVGEGYEAIACADAAALLDVLARGRGVDLIVLDLRLPDRDGLALAAGIRATSTVPIIILSGRGDDIDRIMGLEIGADDYVVKPFNTRELLARIKAVRRRLGHDFPSLRPVRNGYRFDGYELDYDRRILSAPNGAPIALTVAEFDLLHALVQRHGRVLSRDQLLDVTHRVCVDVFDRTIDVLILRLRRKIEPNPNSPRYIRTERGHGYIFDANVTKISLE